MVGHDRYRAARDRLFRQAALKGAFRPREVLLSVLDDDEATDVLLQGQLLSALRDASTVAAVPGDDTAETWLMRPIPRQKALSQVVMAEVAPDTEIARALHGQAEFAPDALARTLADPPDSATLARLLETLERAGPQAPGHRHLLALGGALQARRSAEEADALLEGVFVGRTDEIATIEAALDAPQTAQPLQTLHISGLPGVGKTFLLEQITRLSRARPEIVTVRLDFDRAALRTGETEAIFDEASRQIGYAIPQAASDLQGYRLEATERRTLVQGNVQSGSDFEMLHHMVEVLTGAGRRVLFLLDTLEVLHGHGATHIERLMQNLDRFTESGKLAVNVISGGRGRIFPKGHPRLRDLIPLDRLEDVISGAILEKRGVPGDLRPRIVELSRGNPLRLILVSRAVMEDGGALGEAQIRAAGNGYLYRAILSRVPGDLPRIAAEGLILPRLDAYALTEIVGPALGSQIDPDRAAEILETLEMQRWLVTRHSDGGLTHDPDVRAEVLDLTYEQSPDHTAAINRRAAEVFAGKDPLRHIYHRLQLCRVGEALPDVPADIAWQIEGTLFQDLPPEARDAVLRARGDRSAADMAETAPPEATGIGRRLRQSAARPGQVWMQIDPAAATPRLVFVDPPADPRPIGDGALSDLRNTLESGDRREASHLMRTRFAQPFAHDGEAGRLALVHQWRTGQWSMARILFDLTAPDTLDSALEDDPGLTGIALLELWAEFRHADLGRRLADKSLCDIARHAISSAARTRLHGGALEFAFLSGAGPLSLGDCDALSAVTQFLPDAAAEPAIALQNRAEALRSSYGLTFAPGQSDPRKQSRVHAAAAIAPVNPYADPILALIEELEATGRGKILDDLRAFRGALTELARLFAPDVTGVEELQSRLSTRPGEILRALTALGLTAEFARGYTFYSPVADLPTVALAAERWQQTVSGLWAYDSPPPEGWTGSDTDATVAARTLALNSADQTGATARRALRIWFDPSRDTPRETPAMLRKRLEGIYAEIAGDMTLFDRLAILQRAGLPTVQQPPVAVLASRGRPILTSVPDTHRARRFPMGNARQEESFRRLEAMGAETFDRTRATVDRSPPVLAELGFSADRVIELLDAPLDNLESVGAQPSQLEAIVQMVGRPPLVVTNGTVEGKHTLNDEFPPNVDGLITAVEPLTVSVGRVEFFNHDLAWGGTAWVVAEEDDHLLVATNRHVAALVARRTFRGDGIFMFAPGNVRYRAQVDFLEEVGSAQNPDAVFQIDRFTYLADDAAADIAIGRIARPAADASFKIAPLPLADKDGGHHEPVAVVGYPARDSLRNDPTKMEAYFKGLYDVKRFSPGFLRVQPGPTILSHDCTTLGGNSGSPVISLDSGKVVGLHFAGRFGKNNSAVRISTVRAVLDGAAPTQILGASVAQPERPDGAHDAGHFDGRHGYDPDFLQVAPVPLPVTRADIPLSRPTDATDDRPFELKYQNFGVLYSGAVKSPILAALNIDGALTRPQKRGNDKWYSDGRLPAAEQLGKEDYDDPAIDRGHLIRRAATNWGETEAQARQANADSFHYTCAAPQHMAFNRSTAQWLGLEDYIMSNARTHGFRCCVFTGPIFSAEGDEPLLKDTGAPIPLRFFKVVTMLAEEDGSNGILRLHATAYVLSQVQAIQQLMSDQGLTESAEGFEFGAFKTFQMRIADLEEMSGFDFGALRDADPLATRVEQLASEGPAPRSVFALEDYANIVL